jgi:GntR family transcriptional regulator/MocR family aminotransferase
MPRTTRVRTTGLSLDPSRDEPLYQQIFDQIVERIQSGAFAPAYRLPPTRHLATELATHRNTVVHAYAALESAGFVSSEVGRGTFVAARSEGRAHERPSEPPAGAAGGGMPWSSLLSRGAVVEPLRRAERIGRRTVGKDAINLTRMSPSADLLPHELLRRCTDHVLRTKRSAALSYAPAEGLSQLRGLIAEDLARQGVPAKADDIVVTTGSQQALDVLARALVNPGDPFLVDSTTYGGAINLLSLAGARLVPIPSDDEGPDPTALARFSRAGAKGLYLMPNAHNPTGAVISAERRAAIVRWSRDAGVPIIEDDYGADLVLSDDPAPPALRAMDGDVLHVGTFSKRLIPGLRVGFVVCPPALRPTVVALKGAMDLGTSALVQYALAEFLERGYLRAHLNRTLPEYRARRDALQRGLAAHLPRGLRWREPGRGLVLWLPLPRAYEPEDVFEEAHRRGVLVGPGGLYAADSEAARGLRLTFCAEPVDRIAIGTKRLGDALRAMAAQRPMGTYAEAQSLEAV